MGTVRATAEVAVLKVEVSSVGSGDGAALSEAGDRVLRHRPGPPVRGWRRRGQHLALGLRAATVVTRHLPERTRYWLADIVGHVAHLLARRRAAIAAENYVTFTHGDRRAAVRLTRRAFVNYARTVTDFLVLDRLLDQLVRSTPPPATEPLRRELARGRAAIVVTPHFGNWDLGAAVTATCGRPVHAVADQFGPPAVDELVRATRERLGVRIISAGPASAREALRALHRGDVLCLAADIDKSGAGVAVRFLGRSVSFPAGPAILALRTGAALIPGYVRRLPGQGHEAVLWNPIEVPSEGSSEARVQAMTQGMAESFEAMIRLDPSQWFAFHHLGSGRPRVGAG